MTPKKKRLSFVESWKKIKKLDEVSFDSTLSRDIESEITLNKILDFSLSSETIKEFFKKSLIEIGKLTWLCGDAKCSVCLLDLDEKNLILTAHKNLSDSEIKNCSSIPLIGKLKNELDKLEMKTSGPLINEIAKYFTTNKRNQINRYIMGIKRGNKTPGLVYVQTKNDLTKDESAGKFIAAFTNIAAETIIRKENEAELLFERKAAASIAELSNLYLSSAEISIDDISEMVLKKAQEFTKSAFGFVSHLDPHTGYMVIPTFSKSVWGKCRVKGKSRIFKKFKGIWGRLLKTKKPIISNNPKANSYSNGVPKGHVKIENFIAVPAIFNNKLIGLLAVANAAQNYSQTELTYVKRLGDFYAITLNRKFEEDKLKYAEEKYRSIIESSNNLIYTINPKGIVTFINDNVKKYGYKPSEVIGKHMSEFCHPDDLKLAYGELERLLKTGKPAKPFIIRFKRKNGTYYYGEQRSNIIYKNGKIESTISSMYDITERKEMQDKIKKNEELLQTILDTATDIILVKDINHKFLKVNKACAKFFNISAEKLIGKTSYDIFSKAMAEKATKEEELVLKHGKTLNLDTVRTTATETKIINAIKTPIKNKKGEITGLLAILRDVTEFRKLQEESMHKQVLEEAGKITGKAAHDFNNVLAAINGYSTLVLEELGEKNPVRMEIEAIKSAVGRAVAITAKMQDIRKK